MERNLQQQLLNHTIKTKEMKTYGIIGIFIAVLMIIGELRCVYKMLTCNWEPIGKAEIVYTVGVFTGLGTVIGYLNIHDK